MKFTYPTRNEARGILSSLAEQNQSRTTSLHKLCAYCIFCYEKKYNLEMTSFIFTYAFVDVFPKMTIDDEIFIETIMSNNKSFISSESIDSFFIDCIGEKLESFSEKLTDVEQIFKLQVTNLGASTYDPVWFNNSQKFIYPLLASYQKFKIRKGMIFGKQDMMQIPIDYSLVLCYNHFIQNGYINKEIISSIVKIFTDTANACLNIIQLKYSDIENYVLKDISNPKCIKAAIDLIKQL